MDGCYKSQGERVIVNFLFFSFINKILIYLETVRRQLSPSMIVILDEGYGMKRLIYLPLLVLT